MIYQQIITVCCIRCKLWFSFNDMKAHFYCILLLTKSCLWIPGIILLIFFSLLFCHRRITITKFQIYREYRCSVSDTINRISGLIYDNMYLIHTCSCCFMSNYR